MRVSLIGPGDIDFHFKEILSLKENELKKHIDRIAETLARSRVDIELLPDRGICFEIAKRYKEISGEGRVIGSIPMSDRKFGIEHLKPYIEAELKDGRRVFDDFIDTETWFEQDLIKGLLGDAILYLGSSFGTDGELNYAGYLFKLFKGHKAHVDSRAKKIHPEIKAGTNLPFRFLIYSPFLKNKKLPPETEAYARKYGIGVVYLDNISDLEKALS